MDEFNKSIMRNIYDELHQKNLIDDSQFHFLEAIRTQKVISVFMELRWMLYLGILLFTGGLGYFVYQNMTDIGHWLAMFFIAIGIGLGFYYIHKYAQPFTIEKAAIGHSLFDYLLILNALLIISLFTYIQVYFDLVELLLQWTSFICAVLFLFMAYRYDSSALLSMGIVAFSAGLGISISPINWVEGTWNSSFSIYITSIVLGLGLDLSGILSSYLKIKSHFKFTFQNFGYLLFYMGCFSGIFDSDFQYGYALITLLFALMNGFYTWKNKEFLFFLYASVAFYIALSMLLYLLFEKMNAFWVLFTYYLPLSSILFVVLIFRNKSHFQHD